MRFALLAVSAVALAALTVLPLGGAAPQPLQARALEDLLETIRRIIRDGDEALGLPVLDPFQLEVIGTSISKERAYEAEGQLSDLVARGLADFVAVTDGSFALFPPSLSLAVDLALPLLHAEGNHHFNALLGEVINLYGEGTFKLEVSQLNATIVAKITPGIAKLVLSDFSISLDLGNIQLNVEGLMDGGLVDPLFGMGVSVAAKALFEEQRPAIEQALEDLLRPFIEEALADISFSDLLCIVLNICNYNGEERGIERGVEDSEVLDVSEIVEEVAEGNKAVGGIRSATRRPHIPFAPS